MLCEMFVAYKRRGSDIYIRVARVFYSCSGMGILLVGEVYSLWWFIWRYTRNKYGTDRRFWVWCRFSQARYMGFAYY